MKRVPINWQRWAGLAIAMAALVWCTVPVSAHAALLRSEPAENATLTTPPAEVRLWFTEPISPQFSGAQVLDVTGAPLAVTIQTSAAQNNLLIITLPPLEAGVYSVLWRVHSTADGHFTQGLVVFGVGTGVDLAAAATTSTEITIPWPEVALRWLNFIILLSLIGAAAILYFVLDPSTYAAPIAQTLYQAQARIWGWVWWCSLAGFVIGVAWLGWQVAVLVVSLPEGTSLATVTGQWLNSRLGWLWWARQTLLLIPVIGLIRLRMSSTPAPFGLLLLGLTVTQSLTSHAAALTTHTLLALVADTLHLLAGGIWIGGLLALAIGLLPLVNRQPAMFNTLVKAGWRPFGRVAVFGVLVVAATGLYSSGREVASIDALITTPYGQSLMIKVVLMLIVGLFGLINSMLLHPALATPFAHLLKRPAGWTPLTLTHLPLLILAEVSLGVIILLLAGLITASPTAQGPDFIPREVIPTALSQTVDDMVVNVAIKPNRPGQNVIDIRAASSRRPPPAAVQRVLVRFRYLEQDFGLVTVEAEEIETGRYLLGGKHLNLSGAWQIDVVVRRQGMEDSIARFDWQVSDGRPARPVIVSNQPWESLLTLAAALLLLFSLGVVVLLRLRSLVPEQHSSQTVVSSSD